MATDTAYETVNHHSRQMTPHANKAIRRFSDDSRSVHTALICLPPPAFATMKDDDAAFVNALLRRQHVRSSFSAARIVRELACNTIAAHGWRRSPTDMSTHRGQPEHSSPPPPARTTLVPSSGITLRKKREGGGSLPRRWPQSWTRWLATWQTTSTSKVTRLARKARSPPLACKRCTSVGRWTRYIR